MHNQVLKRHPLAISYLRQHLNGPDRWSHVTSESATRSSPTTLPTRVSESWAYEEAVPVGMFLGNRGKQLTDTKEGDLEVTGSASGEYTPTKDVPQFRERMYS